MLEPLTMSAALQRFRISVVSWRREVFLGSNRSTVLVVLVCTFVIFRDC